MAEIKPFQGIVYNQEFVQNLSLVIAPPYDVISDEARERLYQNSPYNIIRLIKGKSEPQDDESNNQYTRAAHSLRSWLREGILRQDTEECIYLMEDEYTLPGSGQKLVRTGFTALIRLEEYGSGKVLPHEKTLAKPKEDRLKLIHACRTNLSPIFALYPDPSRTIGTLLDEAKAGTRPFIDILSQERILHRVWRITSSRIIQGIIGEMQPKFVLLADGHHRYETALTYCRQMQQCTLPATASSRNAASFVMMYFASMDEPGLTILPYHRLLRNLPAETLRNWKTIVSQYFRIDGYPFDGLTSSERQAREKMFSHLSEKGNRHLSAFGLYTGDKNYYLLTLKPEVDIEREISSDQPSICKQLPVTILDHLLVNHILGTHTSLVKETCLGFSHDYREAIDDVNSQESQMAVFVNPTPIHMVNQIARIGQQMPQKSTFFYPKLPTGLVLRRIAED
ncbi:MAG: DUF1015 domain-containing protein [bacterium]